MYKTIEGLLNWENGKTLQGKIEIFVKKTKCR